MAKFIIAFVGANRDDEEVEADTYVDRRPFVDFRSKEPTGNWVTVARYRADEIRRIIRP